MGLFGSKSSKQHTPVEAKESGRSKQLVSIVEVLSEGEIEGLVAGKKSVYLDNTPIQNSDNSENFVNVIIDGRVGMAQQTVMADFNASEKEVSVGLEVKKGKPLIRTITDSKVTSLRLTLGVSSLFEQNEQGDTNGTSVDFTITVGSQIHHLKIQGKYSSQYLRNIVLRTLPAVPFQIKVERNQADSNSQRLQNKTLWASYTEIIETAFTYPHTALMGIRFDSEYFANIPTRSYEIEGIKLKVPSNYNPQTRTYTGLWDGTFKIAYSNNPAWVLMDIVTNKRYGLGQRLGEFGVDKWALYQVAQYCDQLIPDGFGGTEPRFTCNVWLTEQRSAYEVIQDICSIFRGMPVWSGTALTVIMDRPDDPVWTYTNANVIDGKFSRSYSAMKARHNAIQVEYLDANNNYEKVIEYISDDQAIRKYGLNLKKITAFGCTSRGQAYRTGRWILETERLETETITFSVGKEGLMHIPGDIIQVSDNHYAGTDIGGRVVEMSGRTITLDRPITFTSNSFFSYFNTQTKRQHLRISAVNGQQITVDSIPVGLEIGAVWSLSTPHITSRLYRAMSISENEDGSYTITALQHEPQKEAIVDNGAVFEPRQTTLYKAPQLEHLDVDISSGLVRFGWQTSSGIGSLSYDVKILKNGKLYALHKGLSSPELVLSDLPNGEYEVVVQAKNAQGQLISEKSQHFVIDRPPVPRNVEIIGGLKEITLSWDYIDDITFTEIWASEQNDIRTAKRVAKVLAKVYTHTVGAKQTRYYWLRHTRGQNLGNFYQEEGLKGETSVDIEAELQVLNEALSQNIVDQVFDVAAPARALEFIKTVANLELDQYQHSKVVYNSADQKLYKWNGTRYESKVQAVDIAGKIASSQLEQALVSQITQTSQASNVLSERVKLLQAESTNQTKALQAEAMARGTAITRLENIDKQQAQQLTSVTTKADNALSGLQVERKARADADKVEVEARKALTSRVANAESSVTALQRTQTEQGRSLTETSQILNARLDNLSVGGRNYADDGDFSRGYWGLATETANIAKITIENGIATVNGTKVGWKQFQLYSMQGTLSQQKNTSKSLHLLEVGKTYTLSFEARSLSGDKAIWARVRENKQNGTSTERLSINGNVTPQWTKFVGSATLVQEQLNFWRIILGYNGVGTVQFRRVKLEQGSIATDWTPAPEDIADTIGSISAELTQYKTAQAEKEKSQANLITGLTSRISTAESQISTVKTTITEKERSLGSRIDSLSTSLNTKERYIVANISRMESAVGSLNSSVANKFTSVIADLNNAKAQATQVSNAVAGLNGKVSSMHTVKTQAISGGRTAIAGIALGATANNHIVESSVIVMADKFNVVANNQDRTLKALFRVENGKTSINGDLVASGSITSTHLATHSVTAGAISAGAIRSAHLATGQISADKLAIGLGGNLLPNPILANNGHGWGNHNGTLQGLTIRRDYRGKRQEDWWLKDGLDTETLLKTTFGGNVPTLKTGQWTDCIAINISVIPGHWYMFSAYALPYRCNGFLLVEKLNESNDHYISGIANSTRIGNIDGGNASGSFQHGLKDAPRHWVKFQAPDTGRVRLAFRIDRWLGSSPDAYFARPMLEECTQYTTEPSPWQNAGVTAIHGGSIVTESITAQKIGVGQITTNHLVTGAVSAEKIASNAITATKIAARAISAEKLSIQTLSSVSSNLGNITGGSLNINNRFKVDHQGRVEMRSNSNNVGMVINNDQIIVYDQNGRIRVKIGRL